MCFNVNNCRTSGSLKSGFEQETKCKTYTSSKTLKRTVVCSMSFWGIIVEIFNSLNAEKTDGFADFVQTIKICIFTVSKFQ